MERGFYYILEGRKPKPASQKQWRELFSLKNRYKRIVDKTLVGETEVSTIFLGLDHNYSYTGPPVLFETMIFGGEHDQYQERYTTWDDAEAGHAKAVALVKAGK